MIYELRTYDMRPGSIEEFERRVEEALPHRTHLSPMAAFWHTSIGPLNQVVHIWPYEDLNARAAIRAEAAKSPNWPPKTQDLILNMENVIIEPAPFAKALEPAEIGPVFEIRIYTFQPGALPHVIEAWKDSLPAREKYSPNVFTGYTEIGGLNRWYHVWAYPSLAERDRVRAEALSDPKWPPPTRQYWLGQENKILNPASFSPIR